MERFNRTLLDEWAYAQPYCTETERRDAFPGWLHTYNHCECWGWLVWDWPTRVGVGRPGLRS